MSWKWCDLTRCWRGRCTEVDVLRLSQTDRDRVLPRYSTALGRLPAVISGESARAATIRSTAQPLRESRRHAPAGCSPNPALKPGFRAPRCLTVGDSLVPVASAERTPIRAILWNGSSETSEFGCDCPQRTTRLMSPLRGPRVRTSPFPRSICLPGSLEVLEFAAEACGESRGHARRRGEPVRADGNDATRTPAAPPGPERLSMATVNATSAPASRVRMQLAGSAMDGFRRDGSAMADTLPSKAERGARGGASRTSAPAGRLRLSGRRVRPSCRDPERRQTPGYIQSSEPPGNHI
jgi:hypothetical protein